MLDGAPVSRFIQPAEWAQRLGVHKQTVFRMVASGAIPPPVRITAQRLGWPEEVFQQWAGERRQAVAA